MVGDKMLKFRLRDLKTYGKIWVKSNEIKE